MHFIFRLYSALLRDDVRPEGEYSCVGIQYDGIALTRDIRVYSPLIVRCQNGSRMYSMYVFVVALDPKSQILTPTYELHGDRRAYTNWYGSTNRTPRTETSTVVLTTRSPRSYWWLNSSLSRTYET